MKSLLVPPADARPTASGSVWVNQDGIIIAVGITHDIHTLEHARENIKVIGELSNGKRLPLLVDMTLVKAMSRDAREYYGGPEPEKYVCAAAYITNSTVGMIVANFTMNLVAHRVPTRLFKDSGSALKWLMKYRE